MNTMTDPAVRGHAGRRTAGPAVAALFFAAAWVAGLVIGPSSLDVTAPDAAVLRRTPRVRARRSLRSCSPRAWPRSPWR